MFEGHKHVKKKIIPNIVLSDKLYDINYPNNILPEILLIALLRKNKTRKDAYLHVYNILFRIQECLPEQNLKRPTFSFLIHLKSTEIEKIKNVLMEKGLWNDLAQAFTLLINLYEIKTEFANHLDLTKFEKDAALNEIESVVKELYNRRTDFASEVQILTYMGFVLFERIKFTRKELIPDFNLMMDGNDEEIRDKLHGRCRAGLSNMFVPEISTEESKDWCKEFWSKSFILKPIELNLEKSEVPEGDLSEFEKRLLKIEEEILLNVEFLTENLPINPMNTRTFEVEIGLLSRMMNLTLEFLRNLNLWNYHIGSIIIRSMIDLFITAKWIAADLEDRVDKYISYGLGQEKLNIEHLRESLKLETDDERKKALEDFIEKRIDFLNNEHFIFLQEVNLANWSGKGTREMAIEVGEKSLYDHAYQPFSSAVHSIWNHIIRFDLKYSQNSLNKFIRTPENMYHEPDASVLELALKYFQKHIDFLCSQYNLNNPYNPIYENLYEK
ncbi:DUF5677 domain-containing protein [Leptospira licerasiae]|uniref:DUF5677 domain-containing protein n=1 Tax=Leptospira licerasiae TaxID=447106 RepID=UPI0030167BB7